MPMLARRCRRLPSSITGAAKTSNSRSTRAPTSSTLQGEDRELVAAEPGDGVVLAQGVAQAIAADREQAVAGGVTERVVDALEVVEIEEGDDGGHAALQGSRRCAARAASGWGGRSASPRRRGGAGRRHAGGGGRRDRAGPSSAVRPTTSSTMTATVPIQDIRSLRSASARLLAAARAQLGRAACRKAGATRSSTVAGALEVARAQERELLLDRRLAAPRTRRSARRGALAALAAKAEQLLRACASGMRSPRPGRRAGRGDGRSPPTRAR